RRCGLVGGSVSLVVVFEVLKVQARSSGSLFLWMQMQNSQQLFQHHVCLSAVMLPTVMTMDSPSETAYWLWELRRTKTPTSRPVVLQPVASCSCTVTSCHG
ncbi:hypothetical protein LEMLEM_LOCUS15725, partial [Lemmus lemmus]